jgi:hypothetical protein
MNTFRNVRLYKKESIPELQNAGLPGNILYFCDDMGRDWYEIRKGWAGAISVSPDFYVCAFECDVTRMTMVEGHTVYEVTPENVPENVIGNYQYNKGGFTETGVNKKIAAILTQESLISKATAVITKLQDFVDTDVSGDSESKSLRAWKKYRLTLNNLEISETQEPSWPELPELPELPEKSD